MARNKFDVDETLETPFQAKHLKRTFDYIKRHRVKMLLALILNMAAPLAGHCFWKLPSISQAAFS